MDRGRRASQRLGDLPQGVALGAKPLCADDVALAELSGSAEQIVSGLGDAIGKSMLINIALPERGFRAFRCRNNVLLRLNVKNNFF